MGSLLFFPFVSGFLLLIGIIGMIYLVTRFILYLFQSFGLLRIAKNENYKYPYIVWIPILSDYVLARYCMNRVKSLIFCLFTLIFWISFAIFFTTSNSILYHLTFIYNLAYFVLDMFVMNKFYKKVYKKHKVFTILTVVTIGLLKPLFIYTTRINCLTQKK